MVASQSNKPGGKEAESGPRHPGLKVPIGPPMEPSDHRWRENTAQTDSEMQQGVQQGAGRAR